MDGWMDEWMNGQKQQSNEYLKHSRHTIQYSTWVLFFFLGHSPVNLDSGAATGAHAGTLMDLNLPCLHGCAKQTILVCRQKGRESKRDIEWVRGRIEDFFHKPQGSFGL